MGFDSRDAPIQLCRRRKCHADNAHRLKLGTIVVLNHNSSQSSGSPLGGRVPSRREHKPFCVYSHTHTVL